MSIACVHPPRSLKKKKKNSFPDFFRGARGRIYTEHLLITEQVYVSINCYVIIEYLFQHTLQKDLDDPPLEEALNSAYFGHFRGKRSVRISLKSLSHITLS